MPPKLSINRAKVFPNDNPDAAYSQYSNILKELASIKPLPEHITSLKTSPIAATDPEKQSRTLTDLPLELQLQVLSHLPWQTQANCMFVCKSWREILTTSSTSRGSRYTVYHEPRTHYMWNQQFRQVKFRIFKNKITELYFAIHSQRKHLRTMPIEEKYLWTVNMAGHPILNDPLFLSDPNGVYPPIGERINDWGEVQQEEHTQPITWMSFYARSAQVSHRFQTPRVSKWSIDSSRKMRGAPRPMDMTHRDLFLFMVDFARGLEGLEKRKGYEICVGNMEVFYIDSIVGRLDFQLTVAEYDGERKEWLV